MTEIPAEPKAFVFDLLTALLDSWTVWDASIPAECEGKIDGQTWRKRYLEVTYTCGSYVAYEELVARAAKDVGLPATAAENLRNNWDMIKPWSEVPEVLSRLREKGYKLAVVTNCSIELGSRAVNNCEKAVREAGHAGFMFDEVLTAEECGKYKPDPKPYLDTLKLLNVEAKDAIFVAGSAGDVGGAASVGMTVCWNNHFGLAKKGDATPLKEARTLTEAIDRWLV